jgi:hypothetical protein
LFDEEENNPGLDTLVWHCPFHIQVFAWSQNDAHTTRHLTTRHLTARHLTTRHFSTRHPDNSSLWQLATLTTRHLTTRHPDNSPPWQLATITTRHHGVYAWIILFVLIIFYFNVCTVHIVLPGFFIQYFADFWFWSMRSLVTQFVCNIFNEIIYRVLLQMNYISCPKFCVVVFVD